MKAPRIAACADTMAKRAVDEGWDHQTYVAAVLAVLGGETLPEGLVVTHPRRTPTRDTPVTQNDGHLRSATVTRGQPEFRSHQARWALTCRNASGILTVRLPPPPRVSAGQTIFLVVSDST
jgi:hypothetical protein